MLGGHLHQDRVYVPWGEEGILAVAVLYEVVLFDGSKLGATVGADSELA